MTTMTLEQVRDMLRSAGVSERGQYEYFDRDDLKEMADAIDAHLARGERDGEVVAWRWQTIANGVESPWRTTTDKSVVDQLIKEPAVYRVHPLYTHPASSQPVATAGDDMDEIYAWLRKRDLMQNAAEEGEYQVSNIIAALDDHEAALLLSNASTPAEVTDEFGPTVKISKRCTGCKALVQESYRVQSDSGCDIYCGHPAFAGLEKGRKYIADSCRDTPDWCPAVPASPSAPRVGVPEGVIGYVHPVMLEGNSLAIEVSRMRLSNVQLPVILAPTQPVVPDESLSDGDMFWTDDSEEYSLSSIDEVVEGWYSDSIEDGTVIKIYRAKTLGPVWVKCKADDNNGNYSYELLAAATEPTTNAGRG